MYIAGPHTIPSMYTATVFDSELLRSVSTAPDIAVLFDTHLNYVALNEGACRQLNVTKEEVLGQCILDLYPDIIASTNHRNLLRALSGESIMNFRLTGRTGTLFRASYLPIYPVAGLISGVLVNATPINE